MFIGSVEHMNTKALIYCSLLIGNAFNDGAMKKETQFVKSVTRYLSLHMGLL